MDKLSRLQALTGEEGVIQQDKSIEINWHPTVQASNVYEGTDSEDDAVIMSRGRIEGQYNAGFISTQDGTCPRKLFPVLRGLVC
jgi:hypothetical protein